MENPMKKRKMKSSVGLILLFLIGLSILLYPTVSNLWNTYRAKQLITNYQEKVDTAVDQDEKKKMLQEAYIYNQNLTQEEVPDAFAVRDRVRDEKYEELLNPNKDGMMGYIDIPAINIDIPIYHYTTEEVLQKGAGHLFGSSLPVGGEGTHSIISAHRGVPSAKLFTDLNLVEKGDVFYIHVLDETLAYKVDQIKTVLPEETENLAVIEGKDYVTLLTCTPYAVNTHRLLVRGHRIAYKSGDETKQQTRKNGLSANPKPVIEVLCIIAGLFLAGMTILIVNYKMNKKKGQDSSHEE